MSAIAWFLAGVVTGIGLVIAIAVICAIIAGGDIDPTQKIVDP